MSRTVSLTSRLWLTACPARSRAWVSRARRWVSSKRRAFWIAIPAWSAKLSSTDCCRSPKARTWERSEEHTSELQSLTNLVCRLLLEKKKKGPRMQTCTQHGKSTYPCNSFRHINCIILYYRKDTQCTA